VLESDIVCNDRKILNGLELDIYIPKFKLAIEFDGIIWHSEFIGNKSPDYHLIKTEVCNRKGIKLLHIFENEWIKKQDIVKSKIKYALNNNTKTIFARKCIIEETPLSIKNAFLNKYHIQGDDKSQIAVGAYFDNVLVAVMTFGNKRIALGSKSSNKDEYEMYRFCTGDASVIGIGGKLLSYFIKTYNPKKIISYADRRWSGKNSFYEKIQFKLDSITRPNYWYFNLKDPYVLYHRFGFRKSELIKKLERYDPNLTEWQNMQLNGYDRIWDCGNFKYEWTSNFIEN
jgi:very-short-patch-repair endonuclease